MRAISLQTAVAGLAVAWLALVGCGGGPAGPDDGGSDAGAVDGGGDAGLDAGQDGGPDSGVDAGSDAGPDAGFDAGPDAGSDAGFDGGPDAGPDGGPDAGLDGGPDAGPDAGLDAGTDAGPDAGQDAGDAGGDAGPTECVILGQVQSSSAVNPINPCELCDPGLSATSWSFAPDGQGCGKGQLCLSGSCQSICEIGGGFQDAGVRESGAPCEACIPGQSTAAWSPLADGTSCGSMSICAGGACVLGCDVNGVAIDAGTTNAQNPCQTCDPTRTTTAWASEADGTSCGTLAFCTGGACVDGCFSDGGGAACGCSAGVESCNGATVDTCVDDLHCGDCVTACSEPNGCFGGACTIPSPMPTGRYDLAAVLGGDGKIYFIGGCDSSATPLGAVEAFDPRANAWSTAPSLSVPRYGLSGAIDATGTIYAILGYEQVSGTVYLVNWVESLSPGAGAWTGLTQPPYFQAYSAAVVGPGGVFYMPGGENNIEGVGNYVYTYNPVSQVWGQGSSLSVSVSEPGVTAGLDGTLYVLGGTPDYDSSLGEVQRLSPSGTSWGYATTLPTVRSALGAATAPNGKLYAIGGSNGVTGGFGTGYVLYDVVEAFDPDAGLWNEAAALPNAAEELSCVTGVDGRIYCAGGWDGFEAQDFLQVYDASNDYWIP